RAERQGAADRRILYLVFLAVAVFGLIGIFLSIKLVFFLAGELNSDHGAEFRIYPDFELLEELELAPRMAIAGKEYIWVYHHFHGEGRVGPLMLATLQDEHLAQIWPLDEQR